MRCGWRAQKPKARSRLCRSEPCSHGRTPPYLRYALIAAGVARVVAHDAGPEPTGRRAWAYRLQQAGIAVSHGLMMSEAGGAQ